MPPRERFDEPPNRCGPDPSTGKPAAVSEMILEEPGEALRQPDLQRHAKSVLGARQDLGGHPPPQGAFPEGLRLPGSKAEAGRETAGGLDQPKVGHRHTSLERI